MKKVFPYFYCIFILSQFLIGQLSIPGLPINILQSTTLLMLPTCLIIDRRFPHDKYIVLYFIFLLFYLISSLLTGYTDLLLMSVLPQFLISFTAFWATKILVQYYDSLWPLFAPAIVVGVVDSIVTVMQAIGDPIIDSVVVALMQNPDALNQSTNGELGLSISGLFMNPVFNGHALLFCYVCSMFALQGRYKILGLVSMFIILIGLFFCQQRSAFYLSILVLIFIGFKLLRNNLKTKIIIIGLAVVVILYLIPMIQSYAIQSGSRIVDTSLTGREVIWTQAATFLSEHWLIGGFGMFVQQTGNYPHNLFFSAFIAGGMVGGTILLIMISLLIFKVLKSMRYYNQHNISLFVSACLIVVLVADSLIHNTGFVEADFASLLAMGLCCYYNERYPYKMFK